VTVAAASRFILNTGHAFNGRLLITGLLVKLLHLLRVEEHFAFIERVTHSGSDLLHELLLAHLLVPFEPDFGDDRLALQNVNEVDPLLLVRFCRHADVVEKPGGIKAPNVIIHARAV
jgi:hypothetical protein